MKDLILLVEDDIQLGETVKDFFESNDISIVWAKDGVTAIKLFRDFHPKLVLLDVALPNKNGFEVAAEIRKINSVVPLIFMTGTALTDEDFSKAYQMLYAKNYLEKPIKLNVALAQVKSILYPSSVKTYTIDTIDIKIENQQLTINDKIFQMKDKEIQVFAVLLDELNYTVSRKDIKLKVWGDDGLHLENTLDTCVSRIKKTIKNVPNIKIKTVYGKGYKLIIKGNFYCMAKI